MGSALIAEYEDLLARRSLFRGSALSPEEREALLNAFLSVCRWVSIYFLWRPNLRDEADNHLIELAVAGAARVIVTKNARDFAHTEIHFPEVRILKSEQLLKEIFDGHPDDPPS